MKLPNQQLKVYLGASMRAAETELHLGTLRLEYLQHEQRLLAKFNVCKEERDAAVKSGLQALGLPFEGPGRHFHVMQDGTVKELVGGAYVDIEENHGLEDQVQEQSGGAR